MGEGIKGSCLVQWMGGGRNTISEEYSSNPGSVIYWRVISLNFIHGDVLCSLHIIMVTICV